MKKVTIFLASSAELKADRERFEIEIYRKGKSLFEEGIFLHLDIWEDYSSRMVAAGSQSAYNVLVSKSDVFVLLAYTKVGNFTEEEFESAFGAFRSTAKPFILTYFKRLEDTTAEQTLAAFKQKLTDLKHFFCRYTDANDLWNQFNKELDQMISTDFREFIPHKTGGNAVRQLATFTGDHNINMQGIEGSSIQIHQGANEHHSRKRKQSNGQSPQPPS